MLVARKLRRPRRLTQLRLAQATYTIKAVAALAAIQITSLSTMQQPDVAVDGERLRNRSNRVGKRAISMSSGSTLDMHA